MSRKEEGLNGTHTRHSSTSHEMATTTHQPTQESTSPPASASPSDNAANSPTYSDVREVSHHTTKESPPLHPIVKRKSNTGSQEATKPAIPFPTETRSHPPSQLLGSNPISQDKFYSSILKYLQIILRLPRIPLSRRTNTATQPHRHQKRTFLMGKMPVPEKRKKVTIVQPVVISR